MTFITVNLLQALPMHNLNRDQNGLPKSQYDGGVQRARLSSQALKRPARLLFRDAISSMESAHGSVRTKEAAQVVNGLAVAYAESHGIVYDVKTGTARAKKVIDALAAGDSKESDNILFFSDAELETLARAVVDQAEAEEKALSEAFIQDLSSPSLDVAAFGRMFAKRSDLSTQAAVAVSHAVTTHQAKFTIDYFTALDEFQDEERTDAGAAHLGLAYYTSGVYYRSFTIDVAQLRRSWSGFNGETAPAQVRALVEALIKALPTGRLSNTNAHTVPFLVYVEEQRTRVSYEFETPVTPGAADGGGYKEPSVEALAGQVALAKEFDPANVLRSAVQGERFGHDFPGEQLASVSDVAGFVTAAVFENAGASA